MATGGVLWAEGAPLRRGISLKICSHGPLSPGQGQPEGLWAAHNGAAEQRQTSKKQWKEIVRHMAFLLCLSPHRRNRDGLTVLFLNTQIHGSVHVNWQQIKTASLMTYSQSTFTILRSVGSCARTWKSSLTKRKRLAPVKLILTDEDYYYYSISVTQLSLDEIQLHSSERFKTGFCLCSFFFKCSGSHHTHWSNIRKILK